MAEITGGLRSILSSPLAYEIMQMAFGSRAGRRRLIDVYVKPKPGDRILDIGCGPGELSAYMPGITYVGYDVNERYIRWARDRHGSRGQFFVSQFSGSELAKHDLFDVAIVIAVLHHLDDDQARELFSLLRRAVRPGGRVVTCDNVFVENQNPIARKLIEWDRGKNVRTPVGYQDLASPSFTSVRGKIVHQRLIPYTYWMMECS